MSVYSDGRNISHHNRDEMAVELDVLGETSYNSIKHHFK